MSNRIDYFQSEHLAPMIPAGQCVVFLEGRQCSFLEVVEIVQAGDSEFGWARLRYNTAGCDEDVILAEHIETVEAMAYPSSLSSTSRSASRSVSFG